MRPTALQFWRIAFAICAVFWLTVAAVCFAHAGPVSFDTPPARFQGDVTVTLKTLPPDQIGAYCHAWGVERTDASGCWIAALNTLAMVNPFTVDDGFAGHLLKHDIGHVNGWSADHSLERDGE